MVTENCNTSFKVQLSVNNVENLKLHFLATSLAILKIFAFYLSSLFTLLSTNSLPLPFSFRLWNLYFNSNKSELRIFQKSLPYFWKWKLLSLQSTYFSDSTSLTLRVPH